MNYYWLNRDKNCKKKKENILMKNLLSIINKLNNLEKKS